MRRYAIYYAPRPNEPLAHFARSWLGRDPEMDVLCEQVTIDNISPARLQAITADPRHYGFHGTLKPPFALAEGTSEDELLSDVLRFAADQKPIKIERIVLKKIGNFLAFVPDEPPGDLDRLAADCVRTFDRFRLPSSEADLERRRAAGLSKRQDKFLVKWGYPYVLDQFRFHLTLTGPLEKRERKLVRDVLNVLAAPVCAEPIFVRDLVIFTQDDRQSPFRMLARFPLAGVW
jgi:putative phosphonate metabolism protein